MPATEERVFTIGSIDRPAPVVVSREDVDRHRQLVGRIGQEEPVDPRSAYYETRRRARLQRRLRGELQDETEIELPEMPEAQFEHWFLGLPRAMQWLYGAPIVVVALGCVEMMLNAPRGPQAPSMGIWFTLTVLVVSVVLSELLRPKPKFEDARPNGLGDVQVATATEGRPVPLLWGTVLVKGPNVVDYSDFRQDAITEKVKTGLFSSDKLITGFRYFLAVQYGICRGPGCVLKQVLIGENEAFAGTVTGPEGRFNINEVDFLGGDEFGAGGIQTTVDFYSGEVDQPVSAFLDTAARQRITTAATPSAPIYSGTCYLMMREFTNAAPLGSNRGAYIGNSTSLKPWSFEVQRFPALFPGQSAGHNAINTDDANPINIIYELLTNVEWGFGINPTTIDTGVGSTFLLASDNVRTELNGMSWFLDRQIPAQEILNEIQRQIEGIVFLNPLTGKWEIQLVRGPDDTNFGYDIDTVPQFTRGVIEKLKDPTQGAWEDTTNNIQLKFNKRDDEYKESYAVAQDMANAIILSAGSFLDPISQAGQVSFPGVKNSALANQLVWRELDGQSFPLFRATFVTNRKFFNLTIGGVFAFIDDRYFAGKQAMRVNRIDYGTLTNNKMTIEAVEDVFAFSAPSFGDPPPTDWVPPEISLVAFPAAEQTAFEAPRGLVTRDPGFSGDPNAGKIWCGARRQGGEVAFTINQRNASGTPAASYALAGEVVSFVNIGQLNADLDAGVANPTAAITIDPTPDAQLLLEGLFEDASTIQDLGVDLVQLIKVNDEFMLVQSASLNASDVDFENVYRGVLGTGQANHVATDDVFLVFVGGGITDTTFDNTFNVDIELRMRSASEVFASTVTTIAIDMDRRGMRSYPPNAVAYNGSGTQFNTPALEGDGAGLNGVGFDVDWRRSRFTASDEVQELLADNTPDATTDHRVQVYVAPAGANDLAFDSGWVSGTGPETPTQVALIRFAAAGTEIEVRVDSRHDIDTLTDIENWTPLLHRVTPTSPRSSQFYLGGDIIGASGTSNTYTVATTSTHNVTIGAAYATSNVQIDVNGGGFNNIITFGNTTGAIALNSGDNVILQHTVAEGPDPNFVEIDDGTSDVAYGAFSA